MQIFPGSPAAVLRTRSVAGVPPGIVHGLSVAKVGTVNFFIRYLFRTLPLIENPLSFVSNPLTFFKNSLTLLFIYLFIYLFITLTQGLSRSRMTCL